MTQLFTLSLTEGKASYLSEEAPFFGYYTKLVTIGEGRWSTRLTASHSALSLVQHSPTCIVPLESEVGRMAV